MKARIKACGKWSDIVDIISIQVVPRIRMQRNDLEYQIEQSNEYHIIWMDDKGVVQEDSYGYLPEIQITPWIYGAKK